MSPREVTARVGIMAGGHAKKAAAVYRDEVLAPVAGRVEAMPEGSDDDDAETNEANLRRLLDGLEPGLLGEMRGDGLVESMRAVGVQSAMLGCAATPRVTDEARSEKGTRQE